MDDDQLLKCLSRFAHGPAITLYHVDATGDFVRNIQSTGRDIPLKKGEFCLTTNVEVRTGFKGGAGLNHIVAFKLDQRFVMLLKDLSLRQRTAGAAEKGFKFLLRKEIAIPRVTFEGGGRGVKLPPGEINFNIRIKELTPEMKRLFQLSIQRVDHMRLDPSRLAGDRLVRIKQSYPLLPPPTGIGPARRFRNGANGPDFAAEGLGSAFKSVGGDLLFIGIQLLLAGLASKIQGLLDDAEMKEDMERLKPKIKAQLAAKRTEVAEILLSGRRAYAHVTIRFERRSSVLGFEDGGIADASVPTVLFLDSVEVKATSVVAEPNRVEPKFQPFMHGTSQRLTQASEIRLSEEELELYRDYKAQMQWYDDAILSPWVDGEGTHALYVAREEFLREFHEAWGRSAN